VQIWYFTEQQYHPAWEKVGGPIRNTPPTSLMDPEIAADLMDRYYEEYGALDELGLNIAVNEHHTSFQSMSCAPYLSIAAIARTTRRARLLSIGSPLAQRPDPVRIAEEAALADILSRGRTELGMIRSVPWEYFNAPSNPVGLQRRFWEAHDLIVKALRTRSGPFAWQGEFFHYHNVNVVPRPYQDPHPPIWITGSSPNTARSIAEKGYVAITTQSGTKGAAPFFAAYRDQYRKTHGCEPDADRMAYLCYVAIAHNEPAARAIAQKIHKWVEFLGSQHPGYQHAAGYAPPEDFARLMKAGKGASPFFNYVAPDVDQLREQQVMFWGTPDQVFEQIAAFNRTVGGFGRLLCQMGGYATQEETLSTMALMANEVRPRLEALGAVTPEFA